MKWDKSPHSGTSMMILAIGLIIFFNIMFLFKLYFKLIIIFLNIYKYIVKSTFELNLSEEYRINFLIISCSNSDVN